MKALWRTDGTAAGTQRVWSSLTWAASPLSSLYVMSGKVLFSYPTGTNRYTVMASDGTAAGTVPIAENLDAFPINVTGAGNQAFFFSSTTASPNSQLFRTDGTPGGTGVVTDLVGQVPIQISTGEENTRRAVSSNGLFFYVTSSGGTRQLWRSDGTAAGTFVVRQSGSTFQTSDMSWLTADAAGNVFFKQYTGTSSLPSWGLMKSDGTVAGTTLVRDNIGTTSGDFVAFGNGVYFRGTSTATGYELFKSDGTTAGTVLVKDFATNLSSHPMNLAVANGMLYLAVGGNSSTPGNQLWRSDGTTAGTVQITTLPTGPGSFVTPPVGGGNVFFKVGSDIYRTDGTAAGTIDVLPSSITGPANMVGVGSQLVFTATQSLHGQELFRATGAPDGTDLIVDLTPTTARSDPSFFTEFNGEGYFIADDGSSSRGAYSMFRTDGTKAGTRLVTSRIAGLQSAVAAGGYLYFRGSDGTNNGELFRTDGTDAGTTLVKALDPFTTGGGDPSYLTELNGKVVFLARPYPETGWRPWVSDGTEAGTVRLGDASAWIPSGPRPRPLFRFGNAVYFQGSSASNNGLELWKTDGTPAGTALVKDIRPGGGSAPIFLTEFNGRMYFAADDGNGYKLWATDGTDAGTVKVADVPLGQAPGNHHAAVLNGVLYFGGGYGTAQSGVWRTDGTAAGTSFVSATSSPIEQMVVSGNRLYVRDDVLVNPTGSDLYISDGTTAGTSLVFHSAAFFSDLSASGGRVYFSNSDAQYGRELWTSDGTTAGTRMVVDANPGPASALLGSLILTKAGNMLLYAADTAATGTEPWRVVADPVAPPQVTTVFVAGTGWSSNFNNFLQSSGAGESAFGFAVNPKEPLDELPWTNLNKLSVRFSRPVNVTQAALTVTGVNVSNYAVSGFSYDPATFTATWTLATAGIGNDKIALNLANVTDAATGAPLDLGSQRLRLNVLPGDVNRSGGSVIGSDVTNVRNAQNSPPGGTGSLYTIFKDVNGSGTIVGSDVTAVRNRQGLSLPAGEPGTPSIVVDQSTVMPLAAATTTTGRAPAKRRDDLLADVMSAAAVKRG